MNTIARINATPWNPVSTASLVFSALFAALTLYIAFFTDGWMPLVDDANFAVHEAGHPLMAVVSPRLAVYGVPRWRMPGAASPA